jgi:hypothetical protein
VAAGGVYIAGGITPRLLPRLRSSPSGGGSLLEGFLCRPVGGGGRAWVWCISQMGTSGPHARMVLA